ncbi:zinc ribbon domain-containing protein [Saccharobesus litoralis]|uniref:Zinc ribbon domain-containing protein n=1 Tax=Saccharobesus litoralis TaxID=2172099 RepID=A0A2S0VTY8_9ALTE|nr:zinc ribbon domain-containing protein [Saccharobesus litoralis]AWB67686.1 zinc ribbon domain-containing protein [Saccharobesus litoralis]
MALIACPNCGKRISDKAEVCQHCHTALTGDPDKVRSAARIARIEQSARLMTYSFIALIVFIAGIAYSAFYAETGATWDKWLAQIATAIGFVWYIGLRIRIMMFKKQKV